MTRFGWVIAASFPVALAACNAPAPDAGTSTGGALRCTPGATAACQCLGGGLATQVCALDGSAFSPCPCGGTAGSVAQAGSGGGIAAPAAGSGGTAGGSAGSTAGSDAADGGGGAGIEADAGGAGTGAGTGSSDDFDMLRQICVDTINMYRATKGLAPMSRASATQEACSDQGAKKDGDSGDAHSSAGDCPGFGAQNTCPGWSVGGFSGNPTLADALKNCLKAMWDEGEPPVSRDACVQDHDNCFLQHGHYLNMTSDASMVSCGFYEMSNGDYWMNQDFGR